MTFHEYISALPLDDLKIIASTLEIRPSMISRARLIRELPEHILQPGFVESRVDSLGEEEQDLLLAILFAGEKGYAFDARNTNDPNRADHVYALLTRSLIMARREQGRMVEYSIPTDIRDILDQHITHQITERLSADMAPPGWDSSDDLMIIRDLFAFLNGLQYEPARLTDKGLLYKRALENTLGRFESKDDQVSSVVNAYPDRLDLMVNYCQSRRLVYEEDSRLQCSAAFEQWLHLPTAEKLDDMLAFWYSKNQALSPQLSSLLGVMQLGLDLEGMDLDVMTSLVAACTPGLSRLEAALEHTRQDIRKALHELAWLGIIRLYEDKKQHAYLTITPLGKSVLGNRPWIEDGVWVEQFIVQPTFEILVPRTLNLIIREELEQFAELVAVDVTSTYRISQETIYRSGDKGMSGEAVITFLERHSEKEVPQNVEYTIRAWGDTYGQVYFMDVFLLRTENAEIASHIKAHRDLSPFIHGEVAPDALIVDRHKYRELMDLLRKNEYMPKSKVVGMEPEHVIVSHPFAREHFSDVRSRHASHPSSKSVIGFNDSLPGYRLRKQLNSPTENAPHFEKAAAMQYLSSKQTEELLDMAVNYNHIAVIDYFLGNRSRSYIHKIKPIRIERTRGAPYVEAHRILEDDIRSFKIAHIKAIRIVYDEDEE
jgi:hypothetical protein